jgi:hypothetical protein
LSTALSTFDVDSDCCGPAPCSVGYCIDLTSAITGGTSFGYVAVCCDYDSTVTIPGYGTFPLHADGACGWRSACLAIPWTTAVPAASGGSLKVHLGVDGYIYYDLYTDGACATFHHTGVAGNPSSVIGVLGTGYTIKWVGGFATGIAGDLLWTSPNASACCSPTFTGTVSCCGRLPGATVTAHDATAGGTVLGSTTTDSVGAFTLAGLTGQTIGNNIVIVITPPSARINGANITLTYSAGGSSSILWTCGGTSSLGGITLTPATGFKCSATPGCPIPTTTVLNGSFGGLLGAGTLTYNPAHFQWEGSKNVGPFACSGNNDTFNVSWTGTVLTIAWLGAAIDCCPGTGPFYATACSYIFNSGATVSCPPAYSVSFTVAADSFGIHGTALTIIE